MDSPDPNPEVEELLARLKSLPPAEKQAARDKLAEALARVGRPLGDYPTPGALALASSHRVLQRPHLELIDQAFADIKAGVIDRVIGVCPPQVGKTSRVVWGAFWWMTHHPNDPIILTSYGAQLASGRGRMVRSLVEDYGTKYGLRRDPTQWARNDWQTRSGAALRTGGMDTGMTGNPAAFLIIDDPHKDRAEADSPQMRERVWDVYSSSLLSRLRPGSPILMILTRWHPDDLAGRVMAEEGTEAEGGRWRLLHLPAIADPKFGEDPLGREPGDPLPHPWIAPGDIAAAAAHWAEKKRTSTVRDWHALYQGDPQPAEGALLDEQMVKARRTIPDPASVKVAVAVDPSGGGRDEAGVVGGWRNAQGRMWWTHDRSGRMGADEWGRAACLLAYEIGAEVIVFEQNYGRDMARLTIRTSWDALQREGAIPDDAMCPQIVAVHAKRGKLLRAEPVAQQVIEDRINFAPGLLDLMAEWTTWQSDSPHSPGRIDAGVYLAYHLIRVPGADAVISNPTEQRRDQAPRTPLAQRRITR